MGGDCQGKGGGGERGRESAAEEEDMEREGLEECRIVDCAPLAKKKPQRGVNV